MYLEEVREPFRQYFGDEIFYESKDKLDWVYKAARDLPNYSSFSPNRFPYANTIEELFEFISTLQELSEKPVEIKIVISDTNNILPIINEMKKRIEENNSAYPDDVIILMSFGADFIQIARGFMMSAGCIRARYYSGTTGRKCPVGFATQDKTLRGRYLVYKHANYIRDYHKNILKGVKMVLAVMGLKNVKQLSNKNLMFVDRNLKIHDNIDKVFEKKLDFCTSNECII